MRRAIGRQFGNLAEEVSQFAANAARRQNDYVINRIAKGMDWDRAVKETVDMPMFDRFMTAKEIGDIAGTIGASKARYAGELINNNRGLAALAAGVPAAGVTGLAYATGRADDLSRNYMWPYNQEAEASQQLNPYNQAGMGMYSGLPNNMTGEELMMLQGMY